MKTSLLGVALGSLLLGGFPVLVWAEDFVQDLGSTTVEAEEPSQALLDGLREDDVLKGARLEREVSTTIAETLRNEPDVAIRSVLSLMR